MPPARRRTLRLRRAHIGQLVRQMLQLRIIVLSSRSCFANHRDGALDTAATIARTRRRRAQALLSEMLGAIGPAAGSFTRAGSIRCTSGGRGAIVVRLRKGVGAGGGLAAGSAGVGEHRVRIFGVDELWRQTLVLNIRLAAVCPIVSQQEASNAANETRTYASSKLVIASLIPSAPEASDPAGSLLVPAILFNSEIRSLSSRNSEKTRDIRPTARILLRIALRRSSFSSRCGVAFDMVGEEMTSSSSSSSNSSLLQHPRIAINISATVAYDQLSVQPGQDNRLTLFPDERHTPGEHVHEIGKPVGMRAAIKLPNVHHVRFVLQHRGLVVIHVEIVGRAENCHHGGETGRLRFAVHSIPESRRKDLKTVIGTLWNAPGILSFVSSDNGQEVIALEEVTCGLVARRLNKLVSRPREMPQKDSPY